MIARNAPLSSRWSCLATYASVYQRSVPDLSAVSLMIRINFCICTSNSERNQAGRDIRLGLRTYFEKPPFIQMAMTEATSEQPFFQGVSRIAACYTTNVHTSHAFGCV
jgi:hypothetical protein